VAELAVDDEAGALLELGRNPLNWLTTTGSAVPGVRSTSVAATVGPNRDACSPANCAVPLDTAMLNMVACAAVASSDTIATRSTHPSRIGHTIATLLPQRIVHGTGRHATTALLDGILLRAADRLLTISACGPLAADGKTTAAPDAYSQAKRCLAIIARVVGDAGFSLGDVVKTRVYFTSWDDWEAIAKAHAEVFATIRPANAFIQVAGFASPEWYVEIEAECHRSGS